MTANPLTLIHSAGERVNIRAIGNSVVNLIDTNLEGLFADALEQNKQGRNCYHTINPVRPDANCAAAGDDDIAEIRWLPYDVDPDRPAGVAATEAEKHIARGVASAIVDFWKGQDIEPFVIDSGNGFYVLVPVELPADSLLVEGVLKSHAKRFDQAGAHIDTGIGNAARILRVPGTINRKGENTAERPHRLCSILAYGSRDRVLTAEDLVQIIPEANTSIPELVDETRASKKHGVEVNPDFDFDALLEHYGIEIESERGDYYITTVCPVAGRKHEQSTTTGFFYDGKRFGFSCFASGCPGRDMSIGEVIKTLNEPRRVDGKLLAGNPYPGVIWSQGKQYQATDQGNAERFADEHSDRFRFVCDEKVWRLWDGQRWDVDKTSEVNRAVKAMAAAMLTAASKLQDDQRLPAIKAALKIQDQRTHGNIVAMAKTERKLVCVKADFDRHDMLLNVANGIVDLERLTLPTARFRADAGKDVPGQLRPGCDLSEVVPVLG
jgi:D5 N terminal like